MKTYSNNFYRAAKRLEKHHFLPEATARRVAELAGIPTDRELPEAWIHLGWVAKRIIDNVVAAEDRK